jgi:hypothetical protein
MRVIAGAVGAAALGGALGWFLPVLFFSRPHEFEVLGLLFLQAFGAGIGAMVGFICGGALAARYWRSDSPPTDEQASHPRSDAPDRGG